MVFHVGINAMFLQERMGGMETYVRRLVPELLDARPGLRLTVFVSRKGERALANEAWASAIDLRVHRWLGLPGTRALSEMTVLGRIASRAGVEVLHSVALIAPLRPVVPNVLTIADMTWHRIPDPAELATVRLWRAIVPMTARASEVAIVFTHGTKRDVVADLPIPPERIAVVPLGPGARPAEPVDEMELRRQLNLGDGPLVLAVSAMKEHKNLRPLIKAFAHVREEIPSAILVIPGNRTPHTTELRRLVQDLHLRDAVRFPGWVTKPEREGLYRLSSCFVFPSLKEGFGLPILEAMERELPVACSAAPPMPEVAGDAALYFDPRSPRSIVDAVVGILRDRRLAGELAAAGRKRVAEFSWRTTAQQTLECYDRAYCAADRRPRRG